MIPHDDLGERMALAQAWQALSERFDRAAYSKRARAILRDVTNKADPPAEAFQLLGMIEDADGNLKAAEANYRRALRRDSNLPVSANNLAMILLRRNGDLAEAVGLASRAVRDSPKVAAFHDSLAQVQARRGNYDAAIASMSKAIRLQPSNLEWLLNLTRVLAEAGRFQEARELLDRIDRAVPDPARLPEPLKKSLDEIRRSVPNGTQEPAPLR